MKCPFCGYSETKVTDSRPDSGGIRRRRECLSCSRRFTTLEKPELATVHVVKKDGRREEFSREKVIAGMRRACEKRPIPLGAIEQAADEIEAAVYGLARAEVPSTYIGELVMERLRGLDNIAYIRFASVYRAFADVDELEEELSALKAGWTRPGVPAGQMALLPEERQRGAPRPLRVRRLRDDQPVAAREAR